MADDRGEQKTDIYEIVLTDTDSCGRGIGRTPDGRVVFVPYAACGERVSVRIADEKKNYAIGSIAEISDKSPHRVRPACPVFGVCGGCSVQHLSYPAQLEFKTALIPSQLKRIAHITDVPFSPCLPSPGIFNYRNKASFKFGTDGKSLSVGFFAEETHNVVNVSECMICDGAINDAIRAIRGFFEKNITAVFNAHTGKGVVKNVEIRRLQSGILVNFGVTSFSFPDMSALYLRLVDGYGLFGIFATVTDRQNNPRTKLLFGNEKISGEICGIKFPVSPQSFLQVNGLVAQSLYSEVVRLIGEQRDGIVIDAFCGIGVLSALLARNSFKAYGIEISQQATRDAAELIKMNGIENLSVLTGDCSIVLPSLLPRLRNEYPDKKVTIVLDPPRKGCGAAVIGALLDSLPDRIVYISCNSATLARDVKSLSGKYSVVSVSSYDMFPQTAEVEGIVLLETSASGE